MTRRPAPTAKAPRPTGDPYGLQVNGALIVPAISAIGLLFIGWISFSLLTGNLPWKIGGAPNGSGAIVPVRTPTPSGVVVVPTPSSPADRLVGTIVYAKDGNLWVQDASGARQLTSVDSNSSDSMPSFTPDGQWIVYIETKVLGVQYARPGNPSVHYTATYPILFKIHPDGANRTKLTDGLFTNSNGTWFYWLRQPVMSPDNRTIALFSDAPDPSNSDVVLQYFDTKTGKLTRSGVPEVIPLGQQDAAWSPDGKTLLYVENGRDGPRGAPQIYRLDWKTKKFKSLTGPGYESPEWSPDGRYIVATKTSTLGTDVVILDASTGNELVRVTDDAKSWGGVWSPAGDAIAYLHIEGGVTDLRMVKLSGAAGSWTVGQSTALTENAGLDGASHPSWFIPAAQLPAPTVVPTAPSSASPPASAP